MTLSFTLSALAFTAASATTFSSFWISPCSFERSPLCSAAASRSACSWTFRRSTSASNWSASEPTWTASGFLALPASPPAAAFSLSRDGSWRLRPWRTNTSATPLASRRMMTLPSKYVTLSSRGRLRVGMFIFSVIERVEWISSRRVFSEIIVSLPCSCTSSRWRPHRSRARVLVAPLAAIVTRGAPSISMLSILPILLW
mmetsp:Transcript_65082/g.190907  ORF Transcript_65082/g.190907 Transcript_65082/m.190907 type:complete len:200 (+) Transcript_65082:1060-1659(+)